MGSKLNRVWGLYGLQRAKGLAEPYSLFARSLADAPAAAEKEEDGKSYGVFSSWVGKIKGAFQGTKEPPQQKSPPDYGLLACADELKNVRRVEKVTSLLKLQPGVANGKVNEAFDMYESVLRALAKFDATGQHLDEKQKAAAAKECGCTIQEIDRALAKFEWMKEARGKLLQMQEKGEKLPKTMAEVEKLLLDSSPLKRNVSPSPSKSADIGRNSSCTCGSGKKYKRCCGRGT